ncbi:MULTISPECIES: cytochrome c biogenesis protein ResB [unclassified Microbacterium]|uniref:cytochrome c biogenesis protein ResB n=1 Tax=unclassified Microbacterium TaxID=2609290 RepID=UPI001656EFDB|nr:MULTISPECIES: cytochrome c biogenesis protein ResB [unclassified Microbacterium]MDH5133510.1 cytochrome c biogenesis protein ResB [Microbacterium sp. RD10]MDH5137263.1 cytochrome c biogenesis protein ResB [Microbacterium sp. RD11]MDH5145583.1 cytochrome c biogenesis protein ResB [Microbacterium sp. RD12]MDH5153941.1 cytochrome c biogenesis protein ResB [Microbacterium sp. RD06]MDH5165374.1 cytochrome c biogenesis protein ResB [Microbacterium sp. RD02]
MTKNKSAVTNDSSDPLRPSDHVDGDDTITQPRLGFVGWLRWGWRQLTSMRTALVLLLVLAIAAIPGSIFPQRMADPNGVTQWERDNPDLFPVLDGLKLFDVYLSPWFSAIYLLLFTSLVGCVIPRIKHHAKALQARPPRTPARLRRLEDYRAVTRDTVADSGTRTGDAAAEAAASIDVATKQLKALGYRVERYDRGRTYSVSAERGYWRETGNLLFHLALVGVLVTIGVGGGFAYTGQRVLVEGETFANTLLDYDSMNRGRFVADDSFAPYSMRLDSFDVTYQPFGEPGSGQAGNFSANMTIQENGEEREGAVKVNEPLGVADDDVFLLGNGYAPTVTVRDPEGNVVFHNSTPFLPQDNNMTSLGVLKVPDGLAEQVGLVGFFYPTTGVLDTGAFFSAYPDLTNPTLTLDVYTGDLGINDGVPRSVYVLDTSDMTKLTGRSTDVESIELSPGETAQLPNGLGSVTFDDESPEGATDTSESVKRFASLQIHRDESGVFVLGFALLALGGLMLALFVPRRRVWVKATAADGAVDLEYAALARGEDPTLARAVDDLRAGHARLLDAAGSTAARTPEDADEDAADAAADPAAPAPGK